MEIEIPDELKNDDIYICENCGAKIMCFTDQEKIGFCPCCASVIIENE